MKSNPPAAVWLKEMLAAAGTSLSGRLQPTYVLGTFAKTVLQNLPGLGSVWESLLANATTFTLAWEQL